MIDDQSCLDYLLRKQPEIALHVMQAKQATFQQQDLSQLDLSDCNCWWIDGFGFDSRLAHWLDEGFDRRLFLVFESAESLRGWLEQSLYAKLICNSKITLLCIDGPGKVSSLDLKQHIWSCPGFEIAYADPRGFFKRFFDHCTSLVFTRKAVIREMMKLGAWNWPHVFRRTLSLKKDKRISKTPFLKDIPICIVGAGVSVGENALWLESLKNRALVISAGTAINVLEALGHQPHGVMTIDPFRAQYSRFIQVASIETPLIAGWRTHFQALACMSGERLLFPGATAYPMTKYWQDLVGYTCQGVEEGLNVVTSAMSLASHLGSREIFLLGVDLCLRQNRLYGAQVSPSEGFYQSPTFEKDVPIAIDQEEEVVTTYAKWLSEAQWISEFASHQEVSVWRNKTHHLKIENTQVVELKDWLETLPSRDYEGWFWAYLQSLEPACTQESSLWLKELQNELEVAVKWLNEQKRTLQEAVMPYDISLSKAPSSEQAFESTPTQIECLLELFQSDLQDQSLYPKLLENWSACFNRLYLPSFEQLREDREGKLWVDVWLTLKKIQFLIEGIKTYSTWLNESIEGQFFSEVEEV